MKVCHSKNIKLPYDEIGGVLNDCNPENSFSISGSAIIQHLTKLRSRRMKLGLPVPEAPKRGGGTNTVTKKRGVSSKPGDDEANEEVENSDIGDESDSEASFEEEPRKRVKRENNNTVNDAQHEDKLHTKAVPSRKAVKGRRKSAVTKKSIKKESKTTSPKSKGRNLKKNMTPESPSVGAAERARRRSSVNYAELEDVDDPEIMTDVEEHDPRVASGSSLLTLSGMSDGVEDEKEDAAASDDASSLDEEDYHLAKDESQSSEQHGIEKESLVAVLKFGKSESLRFLSMLDSSRFVTESQNSNIFSDVDRSSSHPVEFGLNSCVDIDSNTMRFGMAGNNIGNNVFTYSNDNNLGVGLHAPIFDQTAIDHYHSLSGPTLNPAMHNFMPHAPFTGTGFSGFHGGQFGAYGPSAPGLTYTSPYSAGLSHPASVTPLTSASAQTFHGYHNYPQRLDIGHTQLPHHSTSTNYVDNIRKLLASPGIHVVVNSSVESSTDFLTNNNNQRSPGNHTASTNLEPASGMLSFGSGNDNVFLTEPDQFDTSY